MNTGDPFTEFLEGALSVPDFDLGNDLRTRLLEAAEEETAPEVIELVTEESWEVAAFNWLVGEQASDPVLMDRLVGSAILAEALARQQAFLRKLKSALRQPTPLAQPVRRIPFRRLRSAWMASAGLAAVIAWLLVVLLPVGSWRHQGSVASGVSTEQTTAVHERLTSGNAAPATASVRQVAGFAESPRRSEGRTGLAARGNLESVREGSALLEFEEASQLAARELFEGSGGGFGIEPVTVEPGAEAILASNAPVSAKFTSFGNPGDWMFINGLASVDKSSFPGLNEGAVPEPSGLLLLAVGSLMLLGRRGRPDQTM